MRHSQETSRLTSNSKQLTIDASRTSRNGKVYTQSPTLGFSTNDRGLRPENNPSLRPATCLGGIPACEGHGLYLKSATNS